MTEIIASRITARIEGDFVVFLIGMRINKPWKVHKWLPVARAMPKMLKELEAAPPEKTGFLGHTGLAKVIVQYWRSFDHLDRYARDRDALHWPAWVEFNRRMKDARGDVGIWHETYKVRAGEYESVYSGMPAFGLGKAGTRAAVSDASDSARQRIGAG
jgi:Monooxygenase af470-like